MRSERNHGLHLALDRRYDTAVDEGDRGASVGDDRGEFVWREPPVQRGHDGAGQRAAEQHFEISRIVLAEIDHAILRLDAIAHQRRGDTARLLAQRGPGEFNAVCTEYDFVRRVCDAGLKQRPQALALSFPPTPCKIRSAIARSRGDRGRSASSGRAGRKWRKAGRPDRRGNRTPHVRRNRTPARCLRCRADRCGR